MIRFIDLHLVGIMVNMEDIDRQRLLLLVYINLGSNFMVGMRVNIMIMAFNIIRVVLGMMFMVSNMLKLEFNR